MVFKTSLVTDALDAEAVALADCDTVVLEDTSDEGVFSGTLPGGAEAPKVLTFAGDAVVKVSAVTCPTGDDAVASLALAKQLSLCECGPNEYVAEACDEAAGRASTCGACEEACGEGATCDAAGACTSCGEGNFLADDQCRACAQVGREPRQSPSPLPPLTSELLKIYILKLLKLLKKTLSSS